MPENIDNLFIFTLHLIWLTLVSKVAYNKCKTLEIQTKDKFQGLNEPF